MKESVVDGDYSHPKSRSPAETDSKTDQDKGAHWPAIN